MKIRGINIRQLMTVLEGTLPPIQSLEGIHVIECKKNELSIVIHEAGQCIEIQQHSTNFAIGFAYINRLQELFAKIPDTIDGIGMKYDDCEEIKHNRTNSGWFIIVPKHPMTDSDEKLSFSRIIAKDTLAPVLWAINQSLR